MVLPHPQRCFFKFAGQHYVVERFGNIENRLFAIVAHEPVVHELDFFQQLFFAVSVDALAVIFQINDRRQRILFFRHGFNEVLRLNAAVTAQAVKMIGADMKTLFTGLQPILLKFGVFKVAAFRGF